MSTKDPSNKTLAANAVKAVTATSGYEKKSGWCQKFTRQNIQAVYGNRFNQYFGDSAAETMENFRKSPYAVKVQPGVLGGGSVVGDILYKGTKTSGKYGHVGIRVAGNKVAENSSSHINEAGDRDARGFRSLQAYGNFELIVRLPDPNVK